MLGGMPTKRSGAASIIVALRTVRRLLAHANVRVVLTDWCGPGFVTALDVLMDVLEIVLASDDQPFEVDGTPGPGEDAYVPALAQAKSRNVVTLDMLDVFYKAAVMKASVR